MIDRVPLSDLPPGMRQGDEDPAGDEDHDAAREAAEEEGDHKMDIERSDP